MQTPSHLLITGFIAGHAHKWSALPLVWWALLVGSILPDLPFTILTLLGEAYFYWFAPLPGVGTDATLMQIMIYLHFDRFFNDPLWIISHNLFHSLIINSLLIGIGWWAYRRAGHWGLPLFWLAVSMQFHTLIDIFTHTSDGPLILFPLNWHYRFPSPVSYWESSNFGTAFVIFEYTLDLVLLLYFGWHWWHQKKVGRSGG